MQLGFGVIAAAMVGVRAEGLVTIQKLSAPLANELVGEAVANCTQKGYAVTAAVVDLDGARQAMLRGNGRRSTRWITPITRPIRQHR